MHVRTVSALIVSLLVLPAAAQAQASAVRSCIVSMNKAGAKVAGLAQGDALKCASLMRKNALPAGVDGQTCLSADLSGKVGRAALRTESIDASRCAVPPAFGHAGAAAVNAAGRQLALDLVADVFGPDFGAAAPIIKCRDRVLRDLTKLTSAQLRAFLACKKDGLAGSIVDAPSLAACLAAIDADELGKIDHAIARLVADDTRHCGSFDRDQLFPGYCRFSAAPFTSCANTRARCRTCEALNRMDGLTMDCESFDDGLVNGSCGACEPDPDGNCCAAADRDACGFCGGTGYRCGWSEISVAPTHACGRKLDGTIVCWGSNSAGELSPPAGVFTHVVSGGSSSEAPDRGHSCALRPDQTVECWGRDDFGQASPPPGSFSQLAAGSYHTCGLHLDGSIECWGLDTLNESSPPGGTFTRISAARRGNCALRSDGEVECWGDDFYGALTPLAGPFTDVEAGALQSYGIRPDQTVARWGEDSAQFEPVPGPYVEVDGAVANGCGRRPDGSIVCWPADTPSQLVVTPPAGTFTQLDAGDRIFCAIRSDAALLCWGDVFTDSGAPPK